jgi:integrase
MNRRRGTVVRVDGTRGASFALRYADASGKRVYETLGRDEEGWTPRKAADALAERLVDVRRDGLEKVKPKTFGSFAGEWLERYADAKGLKRSTRQSYKTIVDRHLVPFFGSRRIDSVEVEDVEKFMAQRRRKGYGAGSVNRQLNVLHLIFAAAIKQRKARLNPVSEVDRPKEPRRHWRILKPLEIQRVDRAFTELAEEAEGDEREWIMQARAVFLTVIGAGLRRGEVKGLRWLNVRLADPEGASLRVEEAYVWDRAETPKSEAGERTIALGPKLADELFQHRGRTRYQGDGERVFCHPLTGGPLDHKRYAETYRAALKRAGITDYVRPFHDGRHTSITNSAAAGLSTAALMSRAGHSDFKTTQGYIDLAGEAFREEAERAEERVFGVVRAEVEADAA